MQLPPPLLPPLLPLRLAPTIGHHATALEHRAAREPASKRRLIQIASILRTAAHAPLRARGYTLDDAGRVYLHRAPLQGVPRSIRHEVLPPDGWAFVAADWRSAHLVIATQWSGDTGLLRHDDLAEALGLRRGDAKVAVLAFINGAGADRIRRITGNPDAYAYLRTSLPGIVGLMERAMRWHNAPGGTVLVPSLAGVHREIRKAPRAGGWRRLLSALWTRTEADAMQWVLGRLPSACHLSVPLFDGVLVACPVDDIERVSAALREAMQEGARRAGVDLDVQVGWGFSWAAAEGIEAPPVGAGYLA